MRVRIGGGWKEVPTARVRVSGVWKNITRVRAYISGAWRDVATFIQPLTASTPSNDVASRFGPGSATTVPITATVSGGLSPYTYSWARIGAGFSSADNPSSATTRITRVMVNGETATEVWRVTVTDAFGSSATSDISIFFESVATSGGVIP